VYKKLYRMGESLECYTRALRIAEESNLPDNERSACHNLAAYYMSNGDYKHFLEYSQRSLELSDQLNDQGSRANNHHQPRHLLRRARRHG
jgi:tetratricopeptide (TPR) repeat protein